MAVENKGGIICPCSGTSKQRIWELVIEGENDIENISRRTGALSGCGSCESDIKELLVNYLPQQQLNKQA